MLKESRTGGKLTADILTLPVSWSTRPVVGFYTHVRTAISIYRQGRPMMGQIPGVKLQVQGVCSEKDIVHKDLLGS